jgi:hypothetical protein
MIKSNSGKIKQSIEGVKSVLSVKSNAKADVFVKDCISFMFSLNWKIFKINNFI